MKTTILCLILLAATAQAIPQRLPPGLPKPKVVSWYYFEYGRDEKGLTIWRVDMFTDKSRQRTFIGRDWP